MILCSNVTPSDSVYSYNETLYNETERNNNTKFPIQPLKGAILDFWGQIFQFFFLTNIINMPEGMCIRETSFPSQNQVELLKWDHLLLSFLNKIKLTTFELQVR